MFTINIEYKAVSEIIPYVNNPRQNDDAVDKVAASIAEFGFNVPCVIDKDNVIITGHTRHKAAKKLGLEKIPCIYAKDLTKAQVKAYRIADNKVSEYASWDNELLELELEQMKELDFDLELTGFDMDEIENLLNADIETGEVQEDNYEAEPPKEPKSKLGDIYQLGKHRLMCGDSTSVTDIKNLLSDNNIDLCLTDPPYGISVVVDNGKVGSDNLAKNGIYMPVKGDETTETTKEFYNACVSLGIDKYILFGGNYFTDFLPFSDGWIIWDKRGDMASNNFADGEMAWCSFHTPVRIYKQIWSGMIKEGEHEKRVHPTQKPIRVLADILKDFSKENDNILDCFGGSGSTLIACEQTNRNCFMIEYEPHYVDVIIDRWEKFTGQKAVLLNKDNKIIA